MKVNSKKTGLNIDYSQNTTGITLSDIPEDKLALYSQKTIENACRLKAKYGNKYSDEYYLNYSSRDSYIRMVENFSESKRTNAAMCAVQDPNWQGYSYEEIIQMENNGVKIPQEVLLWAHAQQESDIVSYEIIESEALNDNNTSTGEISNSSDINTLLKNAQIYTVKSTSAQKTAEEDAERYSELSTQAKKIQSENKNTYKDELEKISKLTKEWKQLDTKNKNGTLNSSEKNRYNELSKTINSESNNNNNKKEVAFNEKELDELLSSMSGLSEKTTENTKIADETIQASEALSNKIKTYNSQQQKYTVQGVISSGPLDSPISETNSFSIESVSMEAGKNLENQSNETDAILTEDSNLEVKEFAKEYSRKAKEAVKSSNNSTSKSNNETDTTTSETETKTEEPEQEKTKTFTVNPAVGVTPSITATATTIRSMNDLSTNKNNVEEIQNSLVQSQEKATKNAKNVKKEEKKAEKEHTTNEKKIETKENELEAIKQQQADNAKSTSEQVVEEPKADTPDEEKNPPQTPVVDNKEGEQEAIVNEIVTVLNADEKLKGTANSQNMKLKQSVSSNDKTTETLEEQNKALDKRNSNAKTVATNTTLTGTMTATAGALSIGVGTPMMASLNPVTAAWGAKLVQEGIKETVAGTGAIVTGEISLGVSGDVDENIKDFNSTVKSAKLTNKTQSKQVKETTNTLREIGQLEVSENMQTATAEGATTTKKPEKTTTSKTVKVPEKEEPIVDQTKEITPLQEVEDTNNTEQTTKPNSQTSPSKVAASQIAEKPLTDNEKIEIIKEEYSDEEINARISDNEENDDSNIIAAASSNASANIVKTTNTDDKLTRKLSRFNNDSIIESRKKMKKVQAVSAASGKKA